MISTGAWQKSRFWSQTRRAARPRVWVRLRVQLRPIRQSSARQLGEPEGLDYRRIPQHHVGRTFSTSVPIITHGRARISRRSAKAACSNTTAAEKSAVVSHKVSNWVLWLRSEERRVGK